LGVDELDPELDHLAGAGEDRMRRERKAVVVVPYRYRLSVFGAAAEDDERLLVDCPEPTRRPLVVV
jgi:hypothetical protein